MRVCGGAIPFYWIIRPDDRFFIRHRGTTSLF